MKFFDAILRFDLETKTSLTYADMSQSSSDFFKMGRLATAIDNANDEIIVLFGGCDLEKDRNDILVI